MNYIKTPVISGRPKVADIKRKKQERNINHMTLGQIVWHLVVRHQVFLLSLACAVEFTLIVVRELN